jgi:hypothetical protein
VEFREALGGGYHGEIAAGVVPGDAGEFSHRLDDDSSPDWDDTVAG